MYLTAGVVGPCSIVRHAGYGRDVDLPQLLKEWVLPLGGLGGLAASVKLWIDASAARKSEKATKATQRTDLIKIAQDAAGAVIADLRAEVDRLHKQLAEVHAEFGSFRKAHDSMIADKEAELALLRGKVRALEATVDAYERLLTANNIPHEKPAQPFFELRESELWPLPPPAGAT